MTHPYRICPKCQAPLEGAEIFCKNCGRRLVRDSAWVVYLIIGLLALVPIAIILAVYVPASFPEPTPAGSPVPTIRPNARAEIIRCVRRITALEKKGDPEAEKFSQLADVITSRPATRQEMDQLDDYSDQWVDFYNEMVAIDCPNEAWEVHALFIDAYARYADAARYYAQHIRNNDPAAYDNYSLAFHDAVKYSKQAYKDLGLLLDEYDIACSIVNLCASP